ncbi:unnamed protein product [Musa acuminata subsp. burmannicoides]
MTTTGFVPHGGKCLPLPGLSRGAILTSYSYNRGQRLFCGSKGLLKSFTSHNSGRMSVSCNASPNNYKRNPDFSRQQKGSSRGKSRKHQEPEQPENTEEIDFMSSKNGSLPNLSSNPRYQATAAPGQREKEIVELFRKVQAQLRERSAIKEEKKIESAQQGPSERGTVDSLLKLLRKHSVNQKKKGAPEEDSSVDQRQKNNIFEDEQNFNLFDPGDIKSEESHEPGPPPSTRPASNFRRKSPVPRMKFQPVFSVEDSNTTPSKSRGRRKKNDKIESEPVAQAEPLIPDGPDEPSLDNELVLSNSDETAEEETTESSAAEVSPDLGSLKLSELRELAKSRGIKGYSKLRKGDLVELLSA